VPVSGSLDEFSEVPADLTRDPRLRHLGIKRFFALDHPPTSPVLSVPTRRSYWAKKKKKKKIVALHCYAAMTALHTTSSLR